MLSLLWQRIQTLCGNNEGIQKKVLIRGGMLQIDINFRKSIETSVTKSIRNSIVLDRVMNRENCAILIYPKYFFLILYSLNNDIRIISKKIDSK